MPLHTVPTISTTIHRISIPLLLDWWQQRKRVATVRSNLHRTLPRGDETYLQAYYRLMEVYSVVKSGGVKAQIEAIEAFSGRESKLLHDRLAAIAADEAQTPQEKQAATEKIQQELHELHSAHDWRLQSLTDITPDEEQASYSVFVGLLEQDADVG